MTPTPTAVRPWTSPQYGRCARCEADAQARLAVLSRQAKPDVALVLDLPPECGYCRQYRARHMDLVDRLAQRLEQDPWATANDDSPRVTTAGRLMAQHPTLAAPIIDGLLRQGETMNVVSGSKVGKSWLALGLALSVVTGRPWLGRFPSTQGRVLLVDNELHPATIAHRLRAVADSMGIRHEEYADDLRILSLRGRLLDLDGLGELLQAEDVVTAQYAMLIFDAKYRLLPAGASENDNAAETQFYNRLDSLARVLRCAVVAVHHTSKGNQSEKRVTDVGAGAGAQSRAVDCHLVLREHEEDGVAVLSAAVRSFAPVDPLAVRWTYPLWSADDAADPDRLKGKLTAAEDRQAEKDRTAMEQIEEALRARPKLTQTSLEEATGLSDKRLKRLLPMMLAQGRVRSEPTMIRGNSAKLYFLPAEGGTYRSVAEVCDTWCDTSPGGRPTPLKGGRATRPPCDATPRTPESSATRPQGGCGTLEDWFVDQDGRDL